MMTRNVAEIAELLRVDGFEAMFEQHELLVAGGIYCSWAG
jgi:hypothetical protein